MPERERRESQIRGIPVDLLLTAALVLVTNIAVFAPLIRDTPLRILVGIPFLLFLPGYALIAALFPEANRSESATVDTRRFPVLAPGPSIDWTERVFLSFVTDLVVVPLLAFALNFTPFGIRPAPVVVLVSGFTLVAVAVAVRRRRSLPPEDRFVVPVRPRLASLTRLPRADDAARRRVNLLLLAGLLVSASGLWYALTVPEDDAFTEFYLVTETDAGEYVTGGYPRNLTVGRPTTVTVVVANHGDSTRDYTVVTLLQRVRVDRSDVLVTDEREQARYSVRLGPSETDRRPVPVTPSIAGEDLRLVYLLYDGTPPPTPSMTTASHTLVLWIDVAEAGANQSTQRGVDPFDRTEGISPVSVVGPFAATIREERPRTWRSGSWISELSSGSERFGLATPSRSPR